MAFIREHQLNIMMFMAGVCGILVILTAVPRSLSSKRKSILALMEFSAMMLLMADRAAYIYRGNTSELAVAMTRITNGLVFFMQVFIPQLVTRYMYDLLEVEGGLSFKPRRLILCEILFVVGTIAIIISQFTGLYYTFDAQNQYHRARLYILSYIIPLLMVALQESILIQYRKKLNRTLVATMMICLILPTIVAVIQIFFYGLSLTNIAMVSVVIVFFIYALSDLNKSVETAKKHEIEFYRQAREREKAMFAQTAEALANAIDAKDRYTRGHSARVAMYSKMIAEKAGLSEEECEKVYYAALLHDVGKIGIHEDIINKEGKLTDAEFAEIKQHPVFGYQILSSIQQSPYLSLGARYHHERYDGKGYPQGLAGEAIPEIARIISVADAYDAMTSSRSYRSPIPPEKVRQELTEGIGTQFDPRFARIMLDLLSSPLVPQNSAGNTAQNMGQL